MAIQILLFGGRTACSLPVRDGDHDGLRFPGLSIPQVLNEIAAGYGTFVLKETQSQVLLCRPSNKRSESTLPLSSSSLTPSLALSCRRAAKRKAEKRDTPPSTRISSRFSSTVPCPGNHLSGSAKIASRDSRASNVWPNTSR